MEEAESVEGGWVERGEVILRKRERQGKVLEQAQTELVALL